MRVRLGQVLDKSQREVRNAIAAQLDTTGSIGRAVAMPKAERAREQMARGGRAA